MELINIIRQAIAKGDLLPKAVCWILIKIGYSNWSIKDLEIRNKMYNKIERKYLRYIDYMCIPDLEQKNSKTIWTCWLQGIEKAPELVKVCIDSQKKQMPNWNHVIITEKNFLDYIDIPDYIIKKWKSGVISNAHFSDLIRLELLIKYGGMWMDATVYLTSCVPKYIQEADLFFYTNDNSFDTRRTFENWFIRAKSNSKVLTCIRNCLYEFWKREKHCKEYFIWNLFAYHAAIKYPNEITNMAAVPHNICYLLGNILMDPYNNELLETIKGLTSVHKLSYKYDFTKATEKSLYSVLSRSTI